MKDPRTYVKCSVSNCSYWGEENVCKAEQILIEIDKHASAKYSEEYGSELGEHKDRAENSSATCCLTFKPKTS
ncbi:hypothetical protein FHS19_001982 [Paenibacillus rhizosphaerae]|uniref:DUF1540 domain-containing protein n=1 Tax=Paenibacillus rhizosphaerae TaxID=297318 RepID=A0A839TPK4_9BACL|nr:DUF1540 domain-containing protein [Paenibacillus rhizosphaerae]MBB3127328.1 hypothetical protein [Paenibacillus rhizosphaerae]